MAAEPTMEKTRAIISAAPGPDHVPGSNWSFTTTLSVPTTLGPGEILVEMSGTGICHTDLLVTSYPAEAPGMQYPRVAGHEGAGYIRALGPHLQNQDLSVGDPVLLSFDSCAQCAYCASGTPAYCETFMPMNILGTQGVFVEADGTKVAGKYFGQSSFAALTVCTERSVLSAKHLVQSRDELNLFSPLGCGLQTGAGSVLNVAKPGQDDIVMILGLGGVGLSALMAAAILGCKKIIAVDRVKSRIELAKELGATDELDTTGVEDLVKALKEAAGGTGPTCVIDTTGAPSVIEAGYHSVANRGTFVLVGATQDPNSALSIGTNAHLTRGVKLLGCVEGDSVPEEFIPQLIAYYRKGKFPLEKITKFYKPEDFKTAVHDMHTGATIKPVIVW